MKLRTWHLEGLIVATILVGALFAFGRAGDWREWVAALGVQLGFHHASVANRLQEGELARRVMAPNDAVWLPSVIRHVDCVAWLNRYWVGKEMAWVVYFLATGAVSALVGCAVFLLHPLWRRYWRHIKPRLGAVAPVLLALLLSGCATLHRHPGPIGTPSPEACFASQQALAAWVRYVEPYIRATLEAQAAHSCTPPGPRMLVPVPGPGPGPGPGPHHLKDSQAMAAAALHSATSPTPAICMLPEALGLTRLPDWGPIAASPVSPPVSFE